jgi:hypothetical protein
MPPRDKRGKQPVNHLPLPHNTLRQFLSTGINQRRAFVERPVFFFFGIVTGLSG